MPVYNAEAYVGHAVASMLQQSFRNFELIIVNDGSTDHSAEYLAAFADPRIVRIDQPENCGYVPALNLGLSIARGNFVARLDADDVAHPNRLSCQLDFLQRHPDHVLVGSAYHVINEHGRRLATYTPPVDDASIRWRLLFQNSFVHSAVMFRVAPLGDELQYDASFVPSEDYELWSRLSKRGRVANLPIPLVSHRRHSAQISQVQSDIQIANADRVSQQNLAGLGIELSEQKLRIVRDWHTQFPRQFTPEEMVDYTWTITALCAFQRHETIDSETIETLRRRLVQHTISHTELALWSRMIQSGLLWKLFRLDPAATVTVIFEALAARLTSRFESALSHQRVSAI